MTDQEIIDLLVFKSKGHEPLAHRLQVTRQTLWGWKKSGIPHHSRFAVAALAAEYGISLPDGFAVLASPEQHEGAVNAAR